MPKVEKSSLQLARDDARSAGVPNWSLFPFRGRLRSNCQRAYRRPCGRSLAWTGCKTLRLRRNVRGAGEPTLSRLQRSSTNCQAPAPGILKRLRSRGPSSALAGRHLFAPVKNRSSAGSPKRLTTSCRRTRALCLRKGEWDGHGPTSHSLRPSRMSSQVVRCPRCGSTNVVLIDSHKESSGLSDSDTKPTSTREAYKCECGMAFTRSVRDDARQSP